MDIDTFDGQPNTALDAFEIVLRCRDTPASARDIAHAIRKKPELKFFLGGKTPWKTVQARISVDILDRGSRSRFFRFAPAVYGLREKIENGAYPETYSHQYKLWRRRRRELGHAYVACVDDVGSAIWTRRGFLPQQHFPLGTLKHLNIKLVEKHESEGQRQLKRLRYYYCFKFEDRVVKYRRSAYDMRNQGRVGSVSIGFDGWVTENHISLFSRIGYDISQSVYADARTIFDSSTNVVDNVEFIGFINDETDKRNKGIIALLFVAEMCSDYGFDELLGARELEWMKIRSGANEYYRLESWSKYLFDALADGGVEARGT